MGMFVRALAYMLSHGADGLKQASEDAVLNANYVRAGLRDVMSQPFGDKPCMHEALFDDAWLKGTGVTTLDFAKAMIDEGYHPMTVYFPLVVHGAMLIEPTESESKASLDLFVATLRDLAFSVRDGDTERFTQAPRLAPRRRSTRRGPRALPCCAGPRRSRSRRRRNRLPAGQRRARPALQPRRERGIDCGAALRGPCGRDAMRWDDLRTSENVEDRRGEGGGFGGGGGRVGIGGGRLGIGTIVVLGLLGWALGIDPRILIGGAEMASGLGGGPRPQYQEQVGRSSGPPSDQVGQFVAKILGETEDVWTQVMPQQANRRYEPPRLVLFSGYTNSACGMAQAATGPFYCPTDRRVYLDTSFFTEMQRRFGGGGEFAYAYVIAHEVGHHIENLLGILDEVRAARFGPATVRKPTTSPCASS